MSSSAPASAPKAPVPAPTAPAAAATTTTTTKKKTVKKATGAGTTAKPKKKARRKRPPSSSRATPQNAQTIWTNAGIAQNALEQQAALQAALRSDPLWYRTDDPLKSIDQDSFMVAGGGSGVLADQVEIVEAALAANHLTRAEVTPQAYACLLEQARRYALELLADAQDYAYSANRYDVTRADLVLAQELRADQPLAEFTQAPKLLHLAHQVNQKPLPPIPTTNYTGVVLPPKEHQLTARTFDVISGARVAQRMVAAAPAASKPTTTPMQPTYGASRGRQIPVHISQKTREASIPPAAVPGGAGAPVQHSTMPATTTASTATGPPKPAMPSASGSMAPPRTVAPVAGSVAQAPAATSEPQAPPGAKRKADQM